MVTSTRSASASRRQPPKSPAPSPSPTRKRAPRTQPTEHQKPPSFLWRLVTSFYDVFILLTIYGFAVRTRMYECHMGWGDSGSGIGSGSQQWLSYIMDAAMHMREQCHMSYRNEQIAGLALLAFLGKHIIQQCRSHIM